ncbi:MAG: class I SAM-dependent methyltransferase [Anaerolineae bacterium]|jgi:SAM-dependent methyltransferase|nr:class I SAM-dependent methyltransferase [Anaerolineae bacterium]
MQTVPDWFSLWRELVELKQQGKAYAPPQENGDIWAARARDYHQSVLRRWERPDSSRDFLLAQLAAHPGSTVLDIGAGTGAWALLLARYARSITAVEPSPGMLAVLQENLAAAPLTNVTVIEGTWPEVAVPPHDITICAHAMYGCPDLRRFIAQMNAVTRRTCILLLRAPAADGLMAKAARQILGQPHDSANFVIAYNALLQMGLCPNVMMENTGRWEPRRYASLEEALSYLKHYFGLAEEELTHDAFLRELLEARLTVEGEQYLCPQEVRSALVYWEVNGKEK